MRKTILTHFYNEEYLLPWWLKHHKDQFDWGVCINYGSTDNSVEIIKDICPKWVVVDSINDLFDARLCDEEVKKYEKQIPGWKVTLNVTEFLVGNFSILNDTPDQELIVPCHVMVDLDLNSPPLVNLPLIEQKHSGIHYKQLTKPLRRPRCIHNKFEVNYPLGRHYKNYNCEELQICWYGWSPFTASMVKRKLQIQKKIPVSNKATGLGREHFTSPRQLFTNYVRLMHLSKDLSKDLNLGVV